MPGRAASVVLLLLAAAAPVAAQAPATCWAPPGPPDSVRAVAALGVRSLVAEPAGPVPPVVDGRLDDAAWCAAPTAGDFIESGPAPGRVASLPTVVRVVYDDEAVYVAVRLFDPHPDSIVAPFPRRDDENTSDWVFVEMDTRFDRRSGFSFGVNPRGVQVDGTWANDVDYDPAWNGVWEAAVHTDSLGWTAEYRIPFSQVALPAGPPGGSMEWGFNVYRYAPHRGESSNWSPRLPTINGVVSHFNYLIGLRRPPRRSGVESTPYVSVTSRPPGERAVTASAVTESVGADLRVRPGASSAIALSLHPDFGQVEADPSQVNLTTFETFLPEQRPLFVEGAGVFQFGSTLDFSSRGTSFAQESPFYSRRIGRAPHGALPASAFTGWVPAATPVLGALRGSARTADGWSGGFLDAWTAAQGAVYLDSSGATARVAVEPLTNFSAVRASRSSADGGNEVGALATFVTRLGMSPVLDSALVRRAWVVGLDGRHRSVDGAYEVSGAVLASRVSGSGTAVGALRADPMHGFDREGVAGAVTPADDTLHGALAGIGVQAGVSRLAGRLQWGVQARAVSRGFEANDVGFQRNADWVLAAAHWRYLAYRPGHTVRRWSIGSRQLGLGWTLAGERRAAVVDATATMDLRNYWGGSLSVDHEFAAYDPEILRGGPALLEPPQDRWSAALYTDTRRRTQATLDLSGLREVPSGSRESGAELDLTSFVSDRLQLGLAPAIGAVRRGWQYVGSAHDGLGGSHFVVGRLDQSTASLTARFTYAFSSELTLQGYGEVFLSGGRFDRFQEVRDAGAARPGDRVAPISPARLQRDSATTDFVVDSGTPPSYRFHDPDFSDREFHASLVLRWEFLPGSTLYAVWTQQRTSSTVYDFSLAGDLARLGSTPAANALQLKVSYWIGS